MKPGAPGQLGAAHPPGENPLYPGRRRRLKHVLAAVIAVASILTIVIVALENRSPVPTFVRPFVGTLGTQPAHARQESDAGVRVAMMEINWSRYEPQRGQWDERYQSQFVGQFTALHDAGMRVTLGLGLHYTPAWLADLANSHFVDQSGTVSSQIDFVFNSITRSAVSEYLRKLSSVLDFDDVWAIRLNSGSASELLYPGSGTSFWAYGENAQNGPQYPADMPRNPLPNFKPGDKDATTTQITEWYTWYSTSLAYFARWQIGQLTGLGFDGYFQILSPGVGLVPTVVDQQASGYFSHGIGGRGNAWQLVYEALADQKHITAYVTSMADGSGANTGCQVDDSRVSLTDDVVRGWSAVRWISRIAGEYGFTTAGENPGYNASPEFRDAYRNFSSSGLLATMMRQARSCGLQGVYWAHDDQLWDGTVPASQLFAVTQSGAVEPPAASDQQH